MKTTLLGLALPNVLFRLKEMLTDQGFLVQTIPASNPVLVASKRGNWFRKSRQLVIEISYIENKLTRIDVSAFVRSKNNFRSELSIEKSYVDSIYYSFKKAIFRSYGFR